jgi:hypothetical protein
MLVGGVNATASGWLFFEMLEIFNRVSGPKIEGRLQVDASASVALSTNVIHPFPRQVVRMRDEFCIVGIRIFTMKFDMRFGWAMTSFASDSQDDRFFVSKIDSIF